MRPASPQSCVAPAGTQERTVAHHQLTLARERPPGAQTSRRRLPACPPACMHTQTPACPCAARLCAQRLCRKVVGLHAGGLIVQDVIGHLLGGRQRQRFGRWRGPCAACGPAAKARQQPATVGASMAGNVPGRASDGMVPACLLWERASKALLAMHPPDMRRRHVSTHLPRLGALLERLQPLVRLILHRGIAVIQGLQRLQQRSKLGERKGGAVTRRRQRRRRSTAFGVPPSPATRCRGAMRHCRCHRPGSQLLKEDGRGRNARCRQWQHASGRRPGPLDVPAAAEP